MTRNAWISVGLWLVALLIMLSAAGYQRRTGPTYPVSGTLEIGGASGAFEWPRSGTTDGPALVPWPDEDGMVTYPVDRRMNSPSHDAPDCIEPLTG